MLYKKNQTKKGKMLICSIWIFLICCLFLFGCSVQKDNPVRGSYAKRTIKPNSPTDIPVIPKIGSLESYREELRTKGSTDFGSNSFWRCELKCRKQEIEDIVRWFKEIDYCTSLKFWKDGTMGVTPDNRKTKKKIQKEKDFKKMKKIIQDNQYDVRNEWREKNQITFLHEFSLKDSKEEIKGNYCLIYRESELKKYYRKVEDHYYSYVIFYE